jgi:hypothetical protein
MRLAPIVLTLAFTFASTHAESQTMQTPAQPVHLTTSFHFDVHAPFARVALLFGPESEKTWAGPRWQPQFLYPLPAHDTQGAVFTVPHGPHTSIWVNTLYDVTAGRMQYVAIIPNIVANVIDVRVTATNPPQTAVDVTYTRTALDPAANEDVRSLAQHDAAAGPEWQTSIEQSFTANSPRN